MKRVAIGGLHTECSSYSPLYQSTDDFTRIDGDALIAKVPFDFAAHGIEPVALFHDRSVPGGPVEAACFAAQCAAFMTALRAALPLDGVLLLMHGAMFVPGIPDPEGHFINQVRAIVGPDAIISATFDLHGQVTQSIVDHLDAFAAYRTAPHVDVAETYTRAATLLAHAFDGPRPHVAWVPIPILAPGEMTSTFVEPCAGLYEALPDFDKIDGVSDANLMIGYVWADSPRATAAAVVTATDKHAGQQAARRIAQSYQDARDTLVFDMDAAPLDTALDAVQGQTAILADSGDNPTAGGVGDRADVVAALLNRQLSSVLVAGIADPPAFKALSNGATRITIGGTLGGGGPRLTLHIDNCTISHDCAVVQTGGITVIITKHRRPFHDIADFTDLNLEIDSFALLVVKSGYLSPQLRVLPRKQIMALTDGAVCQDMSRLTNNHRPTGTWPFDTP